MRQLLFINSGISATCQLIETMKKILFYLFVLLVFNACSTSTEKVVEEKNVIHLAEAIANPVKMNLSEIVDSIVYVPISSKDRFIKGAEFIFSLASMAKEEMKEREMSHLLGGLICCICSCAIFNGATTDSTSAQARGDLSEGGYGVEKSS